jgi:two-component system NtrC family sensor kinase
MSIDRREDDAAILLVAPHEEDLDVLEAALQALGQTIVRARSGAEALERLAERDFAVVLLDARMPEMREFELASKIRGRLRARHTPLIFMSPRGVPIDEVRDAYAAGAVDVVFKPIVPEILRSKAAVFVDLARKTVLVKKQLEALRRGEDRFRALAETANDAIVSADEGGAIIYFNRAAERIFGLPSSDVLGRPLTILMPERFHEPYLSEFRRTVRSGDSRLLGRMLELTGKRRDGQEFPLELSLATWTAEGKTYYTGILRDVSERKRAEQERERVNQQLLHGQKLQALGQLAAGVAHEINNPTSYILSNLGTLQEYFQDLERYVKAMEEVVGKLPESPERARLKRLRGELKIDSLLEDYGPSVGDCRHGAERIRDIVKTLREFSHPDDLEIVDADLKAILESSVRLCWNELKYKVRLETEIEEMPPLRCNPRQMEQVFINLLVNAAQAIPEKGTIWLSARRDGEAAVIRIRDSGSGIPAPHLSRLFEPFFTTKPVGKGTGLGLYVVHRIVTGHGGRVDVASEPGKGTEFVIRLAFAGPVTPRQKREPKVEANS